MPDDHYAGLERAYLAAPCNLGFHPEIAVGDGVATVRIHVDPEHFHGGGALHGHVLFKALDDAAFFAANTLVKGELVVTADFHVHFLRPVRGKLVVAEGRVLHRARRLLVSEAIALDERDREVARGTGTFLPGGIPLADVPGYPPSAT
jgi:uncharacterized protein (TIGR00369 family)